MWLQILKIAQIFLKIIYLSKVITRQNILNEHEIL